MLLAELTEVSLRISKTRARSEKTVLLAGLLAALKGEELLIGVTYLSGALPQGRIGVGYAGVRQLSGVAPAVEPTLTLTEVDATLGRVKAAAGEGSAASRQRALGELFGRATGPEQELLRKLLVGELRQGSLEGLMSDAIAAAARVAPGAVRRALMFSDDVGAVAQVAMSRGEAGLAEYRLELMRPVQPMLAQTAGDVEQALEALGEAALEHKLDGARVQVHKEGSEVRVFSRDGNDVTGAVPEVVEQVLALPVRSLVLDGEAVALKPDGRPQPFQVTMRRFGRRLDVEAMRAQLPLAPFFFDLLHLDGKDLLDLPLTERNLALEAIVPEAARVARRVTSSAEEAEAFYADALAQGHEGLVAKGLTSPYEAGRRGAGWLKLKPAHTLDLVVLAAEWGSGRRQGFLYPLHEARLSQ